MKKGHVPRSGTNDEGDFAKLLLTTEIGIGTPAISAIQCHCVPFNIT